MRTRYIPRRAWVAQSEIMTHDEKNGRIVSSYIFPNDSIVERSDSFSQFIPPRKDVSSSAMAAEQLNAARRRTFTRWVNLQLRSTKLRVDDLEKDLASGVVLVRLLQILSPHKKVAEK